MILHLSGRLLDVNAETRHYEAFSECIVPLGIVSSYHHCCANLCSCESPDCIVRKYLMQEDREVPELLSCHVTYGHVMGPVTFSPTHVPPISSD
jgi:hypothetical protein